MTPNTVGKLLRSIDVAKMQQYSVLNHHVDGLDYLCLHRSDDLTVKVYLMEDPKNFNNGLLVNPHSHRYSFSTCVLNGIVEHIRYKKVDGDEWEEYQYDPDARVALPLATCGLRAQAFCYGYRSDYWCDSDEIHSIRCRPSGGPLVLSQVQLRDEKKLSELYLPKGSSGCYIKPNSMIPTISEMKELVERVRFYVDRHFNVYDKAQPDLYGNKLRNLMKTELTKPKLDTEE